MARYRNPDSELHIKRIDTKLHAKKQTHGFQVHFLRGDTIWTKLFSDSKHRDMEDARRAAREFRAYLEKKIPELMDVLPARPNATGYSFRERTNRDGTITRYISASARDRKKHGVNKHFRIIDDDMDTAIQQALAWRTSVITKRLENGGADA
jgi:hypothetical protein